MASYYEKYKALKYLVKLRSVEGGGGMLTDSSTSFKIAKIDDDTYSVICIHKILNQLVAEVTVSTKNAPVIRWKIDWSPDVKQQSSKYLATKAIQIVEKEINKPVNRGLYRI